MPNRQRIQPLLEVPVEHDHFLERLHGVALVKRNELVGGGLKHGLLAPVEPDDLVQSVDSQLSMLAVNKKGTKMSTGELTP